MGKSTTIAMPAFSMPYGMLSIDVYIKANVKDEIETDLLDLNIEAFRFITGEREYNDDSYLTDLVKDKVHNYQPDIVGISNLFNTSYDYLASISIAVKEQVDSVLIVAGGGPGKCYRS